MPIKENENIVLNYFTIKVPIEIRSSFIDHLKKRGVNSAIYYQIPIHKQPVIKKLSLNIDKLPNTENASKTIMSIPFYAFMKKKEKEMVIEEISKFVN